MSHPHSTGSGSGISDRAVYGRSGDRPASERPFPLDVSTLVNTLAQLAAGAGFGELAQSMLASGVEVELSDYDNWDGGIWTWDFTIPVPPQLFSALGDSARRKQIEAELAELAGALLRGDLDRVGEAHLVPRANPVQPPVTNQGRAHSANPAALEHNGLFFRSQAEINLYEALLDTGLPVMPLPVVTRRDGKYRRIEPDFVVIKRGVIFVVEVDGDRFHRETPAEAQSRLRHLVEEGARVIRKESRECSTPAIAQKCAAAIVREIDCLLASR